MNVDAVYQARILMQKTKGQAYRREAIGSQAIERLRASANMTPERIDKGITRITKYVCNAIEKAAVAVNAHYEAQIAEIAYKK